MGSPVDEGGRSMRQSSNALLGDKDLVAGGFGELLDAGCHVDGVTDQGELEFACAADGPGDHQTGFDADTDLKFAAETLSDETVNRHRGGHCGVGMVREGVGGAEDRQSAVAKELIDMTTAVHDGRHDYTDTRVEACNGVHGGIRLGERGEVADVDEHHGYLAA